MGTTLRAGSTNVEQYVPAKLNGARDNWGKCSPGSCIRRFEKVQRKNRERATTVSTNAVAYQFN